MITLRTSAVVAAEMTSKDELSQCASGGLTGEPIARNLSVIDCLRLITFATK